VRPEAKSHGRKNQIEGFIEKGQNVVVIEDLISTGASSLNAVAALKDAGVNIKGMVAIFTYNFEEANKNFNAAKVDLTCLCDYQTLIAQAVDTNYIIEKDLETLNQWRLNPSTWK